MYHDVSAIAVTASTSGKGASWGVRPAAGTAFCRDLAAIGPPRAANDAVLWSWWQIKKRHRPEDRPLQRLARRETEAGAARTDSAGYDT